MVEETATNSAQGLGSVRSNLRWFWLSTLVGVVAGLGAILFYELSHHLFDLLMGWAGYHPVEPRGAGGHTVLG